MPAFPIAERLRSQLLSGPPARTPEAVAERMLAIQAQDARGARLAVRARSAGLSASDLDRALTLDRTLLVTWLNRGTLHLVRSEDYPWLHALTTPPLFTSNARRLAQEGVSPAAAERGVEVIERSLAAEGPLTRARLRERLDRAGVPTAGQALIQLLLLATLRGVTVRGPMVGAEQAFALVRDWLGEPPPCDRDRALAELARRYLAGHGPADARDLAKWAGLPLRDARAGLSAIAGELVERPGSGLVSLGPAEAAAAGLPPPRLLGAFEPLLLGWVSREAILAGHAGLVTANGIFRPFALVQGKAAATWALAAGRVTLDPYMQLAGSELEALETDAADVSRFLEA